MEENFPTECNIFEDGDFWDRLHQVEKLILPLVKASITFVPENGREDKNETQVASTLADVVHTFNSVWHAWRMSSFPEAANFVEKRWQRYEHPWMILAFILHPSYTQEARAFLMKQSQEDGIFSAKYLANALLGYTVKYLASELTADPPLSIPVLKRQASEYMEKIERGEISSSALQMQKDWKEYWSFQTSTPELAKFALFLLSVPVQVRFLR